MSDIMSDCFFCRVSAPGHFSAQKWSAFGKKKIGCRCCPWGWRLPFGRFLHDYFGLFQHRLGPQPGRPIRPDQHRWDRCLRLCQIQRVAAEQHRPFRVRRGVPHSYGSGSSGLCRESCRFGRHWHRADQDHDRVSVHCGDIRAWKRPAAKQKINFFRNM